MTTRKQLIDNHRVILGGQSTQPSPSLIPDINDDEAVAMHGDFQAGTLSFGELFLFAKYLSSCTDEQVESLPFDAKSTLTHVRASIQTALA